MDKFLETYNLTKTESWRNKKSKQTNNEWEDTISNHKNFPKREIPGRDGFTGEFHQYLKKN